LPVLSARFGIVPGTGVNLDPINRLCQRRRLRVALR
jgi:hypothetical protein